MSDLIKEKITRWSLDRVQFLLAHIENFVEDESAELRERARAFSPQTGLESVERLVSCSPSDPKLALLVMESLVPFFDAGFVLQRGPDPDAANWWITDLFWRGNTFHLELKDQVRANALVPEITPLQVHRAPADKILSTSGMSFLAPGPESQGYLLRPTPSTAFVLLSRLAPPWALDHIACAHKLVNKCFIY
jgi:hypothetical protein